MQPNGHFSKDSLGGCNHYDNPFDLRYSTNNSLNSHRRESYLKSNDHIETTRLRMERQLIERFLSRNFRTQVRGTTLLAQSGRVFLLALLVPPYFIANKVPKWFISMIAPIFADGISKLTLHLRHMMKIQNQIMKKLMMIAKEQFKTLSTPLKNATAHLNRMMAKFLQQFRFSSLTLPDSLKKIFTKLNNLQNFFINLKNNLNNFSKRLKNLVQFKKSIPKFDIKQKLSNQLKNLSQWVTQRYQKLQSRIASRYKKIFDPIEKIQKSIQEFSNKLTHSFKEQVRNFVKPRYDVITNNLNQVVSKLKRVQEKISERVNKVTETVAETASAVNVQVQIILNTHIVIPIVNLFIPVVRTGHKLVSGLRTTKQSVREKLNHLKKHFHQKAMATLQIIKSVVSATLDLLEKTKSLLFYWVKIFLKYLVQVYKFVVRTLKVTTQVARIVIKTFLILMSLAIRSIKTTTIRVLSEMS